MPCPFTARLSTKYLKNYASSLLNLYGDQCPVISRASASYHHQGLVTEKNSDPGSCPFLLKTVQGGKEETSLVKKVTGKDVIQVQGNKGKLRTYTVGTYI